MNYQSNNLDNILNLPELEESSSSKERESLVQEEKEIALAFFSVFSTDVGKKVLNHLKSKTVDGVTWNFNLSAENAVINGYAREGQNSIYRYILDRMKRGENLKQKLN